MWGVKREAWSTRHSAEMRFLQGGAWPPAWRQAAVRGFVRCLVCVCTWYVGLCFNRKYSEKSYKHKSLLRFINIMPHNAYSLIRVFPKTRPTPLDLQKTAFHTAKGRLLQPQKPYFATRKTAFCKAARNVLIAKKIFHGLQFIAFPSVCLALQPGCITFAILLQECAATGAGHVTVRLWRLL